MTNTSNVFIERCVPNAWPNPLPWYLKCFAWASATAFCSLFYISPICVALAPFLLYFRPILGGLLTTAMLMSIFWPRRPWAAMATLCQLWYEVFDFHHNLDQAARKKLGKLYEGDKKAIFGGHPHGIVPVQALLWTAYIGQYVPEAYGCGAAASAVSYVPFLCNVIAWLPACSVEYDTLFKRLSEKNVFMFPGGVAEIFHAKPGNEVMLFKKRKGLVRLAYQTGSDLVPVYFFGMNYLFEQLSTSDGLLGKLSRGLRAGVTFFWGQYGLPIPFKSKVCICIGEPISVVKTENPTEEQLTTLAQEYMDRMQILFDTHKAAAGYPNAVLQIV